MIEPGEADKRLDEQAEKEHRLVVGRVLRTAEPFGPEGRRVCAELRRILQDNNK